MCIEKGDLERGFADSDHVLQGEMRMGGQVCLLRLKMTIALYLVNGTQRAKEEPHAIRLVVTCASSRAPESTPAI